MLRIFVTLSTSGILNWVPDKVYLQIFFKLKMGLSLKINNAQGFNEKLQWLKLHDRKELYTVLVDKIAVRTYIEKTIGKNYLIPFIGHYKSFDEINFEELPQKFVLKCNHGTHCLMICTNKEDFDIPLARKYFSKWMKTNYYWYAREWPYKNVIPSILCEKFLSNDENVPEDYKVFCFNGVPKLVKVDIGRYVNRTRFFYTPEWERSFFSPGQISSVDIPRPKLLDEMIQLSAILSKSIPHVRIDWYIVENKLYFGEFTFYHSAGFKKIGTIEDDLIIGSWLKTEKK